MSTESKKHYVTECEVQLDRVGLTFQFAHVGEVTWWQRRQDFEEQDGEAGTWWMKEAAESYKLCAARLVGAEGAAMDAVPNISMGGLRIETSSVDGMARVELSHYAYGARKPTLEARHVYKIPTIQLAAAFTEAATVLLGI